MPQHKLHKTYEELYKGKRFWTRKIITGGRHSVIFELIKNDLRGKRFLDAFAGGGRLSFMASTLAFKVDAYDFSENAKKMFDLLSDLNGVSNIEYSVADTATFKADKESYDIIAISGTLENLDDVDSNMKMISKWLRPRGLLAIDSPNFINFRGDVYNTLAKFLGLPMTKTDQRQIDIVYINALAKKYGFKVERHVGLSYSLGWMDLALVDLFERAPLAMRDKKFKAKAEDLKKFWDWMGVRADVNKEIFAPLITQNILKPIHKVSLPPLKNLKKIGDKDFREMIQVYYDDDFSRDPYFSEVYPYNAMGGNGVYLLRKI